MSLETPTPRLADYWPSEYSAMVVRYLSAHADLAKAKRVVDIGTGSGVLAATAVHLGARDVIATDIDPDVLKLAETTLTGAGPADRWRLAQGQMWQALAQDKAGPFDLVTANLPNFPASAIADDTRPAHWSVAGETGRLVLDPFLADLAHWLSPGGVGLFTQNRCVGLSQSLAQLRKAGLSAEVADRCFVPIGPQKIAALSEELPEADGVLRISEFVFLEVCLVIARAPLGDTTMGGST